MGAGDRDIGGRNGGRHDGHARCQQERSIHHLQRYRLLLILQQFVRRLHDLGVDLIGALGHDQCHHFVDQPHVRAFQETLA
ncbi:MAG: hypothetical protein MZV65_40815 [Chromatiales bacterium]|nr:hypothetical protein [Chromatiales bacterium]